MERGGGKRRQGAKTLRGSTKRAEEADRELAGVLILQKKDLQFLALAGGVKE